MKKIYMTDLTKENMLLFRQIHCYLISMYCFITARDVQKLVAFTIRNVSTAYSSFCNEPFDLTRDKKSN